MIFFIGTREPNLHSVFFVFFSLCIYLTVCLSVCVCWDVLVLLSKTLLWLTEG